jgi:hypothetical protein
MATDKAVLSVVARFAGAYPQINRDPRDVKEQRLRGYQKTFADLDDDLLIAAVEQLVAERTSDWPPSEGAIREQALRLRDRATQTDPIDEYEAWGALSRCISALGYQFTTDEQIKAFLTRNYGENKANVIAEAIRRMGWRDLCMADEDTISTVRAQFRNCVAAIQRREIEDRKTLPAVRTIMQQIAARMDMNAPRALPAQGEK